MILMFYVVINFVRIAQYDIVVKILQNNQQKGWGQLNKTYVCIIHTN